MFYYIKNKKVFCTTEKKEIINNIDKILESSIKNGIYKNGKIIEKEIIENLLKKKKLEEKKKLKKEYEKQKIKEGFILENNKLIPGEKTKHFFLETLKKETSKKIYGKYSKETQTTLLYKIVFMFIRALLRISLIKDNMKVEELTLLKQGETIFLDMQKDIVNYEKEKENILKN